MPGLPTKPTPPTFATEANYPAGSSSWNGQALRQAPVTDYFIPATGAAAEEMNYEFGAICDYLQAVDAYLDTLVSATGGYKLVKRNVFGRTNSLFGNSPWAAYFGSAVAGTPVQLTTQGGLAWFTVGPGSLVTPVAGQPVNFVLDGVLAGDQVVFDLRSTANVDTTAMLLLVVANTLEDGTPAWPGDYPELVGSPQYLVGGAAQQPLSMRGFSFNVAQSGALWIQPTVYPLTSTSGGGSGSGSQSYTLYGDVCLSVEVWRPTGVPQ
jgi:hypothetical protein